jgi:hypothetical protein
VRAPLPIAREMATIAASMPRVRSVRFRPILVVAALCVASAALYVWMRAGVAAELHAPFAQMCGDLLQPGDWHCRLTETDFLVTFAGGSLLIGLGVAVPGVVLALSGRRLSALVPAVLAAAGAWTTQVVALPGGSNQPFGIAESFLGSGDGEAYWRVHAEAAILADLVLVSVPVLAVALVLRPPRRPRPADLPRHAVWASTIAIGAAIAAIRIAWPHLPHEQYLSAPFDDVLISMGLMVLFGSMLGTDRRWWPWALVPAAVLLSLGPATAVMSIPSNLTAFTWFADAIPLLVVGFVASLWRPLATRFARRRGEPAHPAPAAARRPVRPMVVLNALAGALLLVSVLAARFDPLGIQIGTALPTYLGARELAQDVRTKTNLSLAVAGMEEYRMEHGSYEGFDAAAGEALVSELAWSDGPTGEELVVQITEASRTTAQVIARSGSRSVFCAQTSGAGATFGEAGRGQVALARAECSSTPLTADALRVLDVEAFCNEVDDGAIVLCRSVQRLIRETLATPAPA